jgi:hypothetical protein
MRATNVTPQASTLFWTVLMTAPLLMPGSRRHYGTIPVVLGAIGLAREIWTWTRARKQASHF